VLEASDSAIASERSSAKEPLTDDDVRRLLGRAQRVVIVRGKSRSDLSPAAVTLDQLRGPTGNYRAPMVLVAGTLLVGFNADALDEVLAD
jgi:hypothetical protein